MASGSHTPQIGPYLKQFRKRNGKTLDDLAKGSGVSKSMLSQIERNQANPTVAVVWRLANALGVPLADLLGGERPVAPGLESNGDARNDATAPSCLVAPASQQA